MNTSASHELFEEIPYLPGAYRRKLNSAVRVDSCLKATTIPPYHIHTTSPQNKAHLFGQDSTDYADRTAREHKLLEAAIKIDPCSADWYGLKVTAITDLPFRLLRLDSERGIEPQGFLALSYCCHDESWTRAPVCREASIPEFPLSSHMRVALFKEFGHREGVWIDQLCIAQHDLKEKMIAIGAMDVVYRSTKFIIVALEDVQLSWEAAMAIKEFDRIGSKAAVTCLSTVADAFMTILASRWFTRAWCDHEFLVSKRCVFLIGVDVGPSDCFTTIRIEGVLISKIGTLAIQYKASKVRTTDGQAQLDSIFAGVDWEHMVRTCGKIDADTMAEVLKTSRASHGGSFMHVFSRVFSQSSRYVSDKAAIVLNTMLTGLMLIGKLPESIEDSYRRILVLALASGDPTALSTSGKGIQGPSWLRLPVGGDHTRPDSMLEITPIELTVSVSEKTLELEFGILGHLSEFQCPSLPSVEQAKVVIRNRKRFRGPRWDWITHLDLYEDSDMLYAAMERFYVQALACALHMGIEWITETSKSLRKLIPASTTPYPISEYTAKDFNSIVTRLSTSSTEDLNMDAIPPGFLHPLLAFLKELVVVGLGMGTELELDPMFWADQEPRCMLGNQSLGGDVVGVVSKNQQRGGFLAVPVDIISDRFAWMSRIWILNEGTDGHMMLISKTRLAGKHSLRTVNRRILQIH